MPLTDTAIRQAKPQAKPYKLTDERGLFLLVQPSGSKLWRFKYRHQGKEKLLALGVRNVPVVAETPGGQSEARKRLDRFLTKRLDDYVTEANQPDDE